MSRRGPPLRPPPTLRKAARKAATLDPNVRLFLYAEGETESGWAEWLHRTFRGLQIEIECVGGAGVPLTLLTKAKNHAADLKKARKGTHEARDEVWIVFDRDDHPNVNQTLEEASDAGVGVVYSHACFELWPILHHDDHTRYEERKKLQDILKDVHPGYDHSQGAVVNWSTIAPHASEAVKRALVLHSRAQEAGDPFGNPSTTAWLLHERCRAGSVPGAWLPAISSDDLRAALSRRLPFQLRR